MRKRYKIIAFLIVAPLAASAGYYFISPKAVISNLSSTNYDEFIITLPSSRISFGPVEAQNSNTILFSRQDQAGIGSYSLRNGTTELFGSDFSYEEGSEIGRVLRFTINNSGQVTIDD
jgi:hypothetical protein